MQSPNVTPLNRRAAQHLADVLERNAISPRFQVRRHDLAAGLTSYRLTEDGQHVDLYRTRSGALHAARMLTAGACEIVAHALTGNRVQPIPARRASAADTRSCAHCGHEHDATSADATQHGPHCPLRAQLRR